MYVRISRKRSKGKVYEYLQLCEAYRNDKGQPRTRVLLNLGRLDKLDRKKIDSIIGVLSQYSSSPYSARFETVKHTRVMDYGDMLAVEVLWRRLGLPDAIKKFLGRVRAGFDVAKMIEVMVLNRLSDPMSKLGIMCWLSTVYIPGLKKGEVQYQHLLRAMDYLIGIKDELENHIYNELCTLLSLKVDLVFYDLTSSYFEGEGPDLASYGYSRDKRPDRKQLVLALVITPEGLPIYHEVLPGNTADVATLKSTAQTLASRFKLRRVVLVCDRGLVSEENLRKLEELGFPFIVGLKRRRSREAKKLYQKNLTGFRKEDDLEGLLVKEKENGSYRYIICHNPDVAKEKRVNREKRLRAVQKEIRKLEARFSKGKLNREELYHKVIGLLEEKHLKKFFSPRIENDKVILYLNTEIWDQERYLDGTFFLKTNLKKDELSTTEVVSSYKELQEIERSFRELKDFLKIRPIFHYTDQRVRAHVFICVLAYLFERLIGLFCRKASLDISPRKALWYLSRLKAIECIAGGCRVIVTNQIDGMIRDIFMALKIKPPDRFLDNPHIP